MTNEEKQLLLKDLCARLPYGVIVQQSPKYIKGDVGYDIATKSEKEPKDFNIIGIEGDNCLITDKKVVENTYSKGKVSTPITICIYNAWTKQIARPYLRPLSSMTEEEKNEIKALGAEFSPFGSIRFRIEEKENDGFEYGYKWLDILNFLNEHHFDYNTIPSTSKTLIESNLALEAPEDMYKK